MALEHSYCVVDFHFIDDFRCIRPLRESLDDGIPIPESAETAEEMVGVPKPETAETEERERLLRMELSALFRRAGWEGDGEINCIFIAPCFSGRDDGYCDVVYHVKQSNNGTSWLAIPKDLDLSLPEGWLSKR